MKKFILAIMFSLASITAFAEASFEQIQTLIEQRQYQAAEKGLEVIIQNHPKSAKAFYAMAQAQAGLGNQEKAQKALDIATGLNPSLDFAPASSVASLKEAITPQVKKIEAIEETHTVRNTILVIFVLALGVAVYMVYRRNKEAEEAAEEAAEAATKAESEARYARQREAARQAQEALDAQAAKEIAEHNAKEAALKAHKNYGKPGFDPSNPDKLKTKAQLKKEADEVARLEAEREARTQRLRAEAAEENARMYRNAAQTVAQPTTVVHQSGSNDMLTGVLIGNMLSGSHHSHDTTIIRETTREVPAPSRSSTWDDTPSTPLRSSSWDDDSSSKKSSSWSSSSDDSSSSSSWSDSSSSSSDSSSSSSWD